MHARPRARARAVALRSLDARASIASLRCVARSTAVPSPPPAAWASRDDAAAVEAFHHLLRDAIIHLLRAHTGSL